MRKRQSQMAISTNKLMSAEALNVSFSKVSDLGSLTKDTIRDTDTFLLAKGSQSYQLPFSIFKVLCKSTITAKTACDLQICFHHKSISDLRGASTYEIGNKTFTEDDALNQYTADLNGITLAIGKQNKSSYTSDGSGHTLYSPCVHSNDCYALVYNDLGGNTVNASDTVFEYQVYNENFTPTDVSLVKLTINGVNVNGIKQRRSCIVIPPKTHVVFYEGQTRKMTAGESSLIVSAGNTYDKILVVAKLDFVMYGMLKPFWNYLVDVSEQEIDEHDINSQVIEYSPKEFAYDGADHYPAVSVSTYSGQTLVQNTDYTIEYPDDMRSQGDKQLLVKGIGLYTGVATLIYYIV